MNKLRPSKLTINTDLHPRIKGPRCHKRRQETPRHTKRPKRRQKGPKRPRGPKRPQEAPGVSEATRDPARPLKRPDAFRLPLHLENLSGVAPLSFNSAVFILVLVCFSWCFVCVFLVFFSSDVFPFFCACLVVVVFFVFFWCSGWCSFFILWVCWCFSDLFCLACFLIRVFGVFLMLFLALWLVLVFHNWLWFNVFVFVFVLVFSFLCFLSGCFFDCRVS